MYREILLFGLLLVSIVNVFQQEDVSNVENREISFNVYHCGYNEDIMECSIRVLHEQILKDRPPRFAIWKL